ncbi:MAG: CCA tRNA nucleotidyltransferase, partial [Rhodospirillales bacterium]|nr:CCA tRNA nucleotidyltransferase [Rhodospirillales bacterium]
MEPPALRITPPDFLRSAAIAPILAALPDARVVGGAVRDTLAGLTPGDIDLATAAPPAAVMAALASAGLRALPTGLAHGTVTALSGGRHFEITTLRRDVATDGRHAEVAFTDDWREDAARRDFTINAMSLGRDGAVFDYFAGLADLRAGRVRFVGRAAQRIAEDRLRILRFFRFHARFGRGPAERATMAAIRADRAGLAALSGERVRQELFALLALPDPTASIAAMARAGLFAVLFAVPEKGSPAAAPEGAAHVHPARLARLIAAGAPADPLLRLAALMAGTAPERLVRRLRLSSAEAAYLAALCVAAPATPKHDAALRRALAEAPAELLIARSFLAEAGGRKGDFAALRARIAAMPRSVFPLRGADALASGIPPGPALGALLE